jgi:beta-phosphoglucomutase family hydrolase
MTKPHLPNSARWCNDDFDGLIFDFDGTLVDSMPLHWQAWQAIIRRHKIRLTEEQFYTLGGIPSREILAAISREQQLPIDPIAVALEKEAAYLSLVDQVQPITPVLDIVRAHQGKRPSAIATGGTRRVIHRVMEHLGLSSLFEAVVTSEDVVRQKPAPDIFLEAARRIGISPERCLGFEDTDLGMRAIQSAGMEAIDVRSVLVSR